MSRVVWNLPSENWTGIRNGMLHGSYMFVYCLYMFGLFPPVGDSSQLPPEISVHKELACKPEAYNM